MPPRRCISDSSTLILHSTYVLTKRTPVHNNGPSVLPWRSVLNEKSFTKAFQSFVRSFYIISSSSFTTVHSVHGTCIIFNLSVPFLSSTSSPANSKYTCCLSANLFYLAFFFSHLGQKWFLSLTCENLTVNYEVFDVFSVKLCNGNLQNCKRMAVE